MTEKLNIQLGEKYVVTGSTHDLILNEKKKIKDGKNAGNDVLVRLGYFNKFEPLVRELIFKEILESEAQTLVQLRDHVNAVILMVKNSLDVK